MRKPDTTLGGFTDQGDVTGGADDGVGRAAGVDTPIRAGRRTGEIAVARQGNIAGRADTISEADARDLAASFERGRTGRRQSGASIDLNGRKRAARIAGEGEIAGVATHGCGQQHALAARQPRDGPPVRGADRGVRAIQGDIPVGVDRGGGGRIQAAVISAAGRPDADGAARGRGRAVAGEDRRTEVGAGPLGVNGDPDIAALGPDGLGRGRHVERHHIRLRAGRGDRDVAAGDDIVIQQRRVILAANPGQGDGRRRVDRRPTLLQDRAVTGRITRDGDAAIVAAERTAERHAAAGEGIRQGPPVGGIHRGDLSVDDDRTPGRDGLSVFETETEVTVAAVLGLTAEADAAARRRRRRVAGQQVGVHAETIAAGLPGDADITRLRPDGLRGRQQLHRRTPAHGGRRQSVDDDVALRRDGVVDVDRADGPDAGQGDLLRGLERRASDHADAVTAGTERVACQRHAVGVTAHRGTQVDAVRAESLRARPPIGEADRGALAVQNDRTPSPDGRGRDGIDAVILQGPFDRAAVERDAAAAGRREDRIQGGDRLAEVKPAPTTEAGAGDRDVADQGGDRGAIQSGAVGRIDSTRVPDRTADAVDDDVTLGAPDDDIVTTDGLDARAVAAAGLTQDGDVSRRGDLLGRTVETHAAVAGGGRRAGCGLDDAVDVGRALQRDAAVGRDERAVDRLGIICRSIGGGKDDVPAYGRRDVLDQSQRGGGTIAIGVDDDVAGRGQRGGVEGVDTVAAARNGCATVAVAGKKNASDRRSAAGRNRTLQGKPRDAAADDTHITQRRSDGADNSRARGADHSVDARGADDDIAVGRQRSDRRRGEAVGLAAGAGGPRSRRGDPADERGTLDGDATVRGGDRTIEVKAVERTCPGRLSGEDDVPREGRLDEIIDDDGVAGQGGVARHRDRTRGTELAAGGAVDAITAATRPGDGQRTEVAARAGAYLTGDVHAVGTATEEGDIAVGRDDVAGNVVPEIGHTVTGDPDITRDQQVSRRRRGKPLARTGGRRTAHRRSDAADQTRPLDDEITTRDRHRIGKNHTVSVDAGIGGGRMA